MLPLPGGFSGIGQRRSRRWESLDSLGAGKADAAGIAYAVERDWLIISGGLHSVSPTEDGRQRLQ
jgi:hypothetical protein